MVEVYVEKLRHSSSSDLTMQYFTWVDGLDCLEEIKQKTGFGKFWEH